ncbi:hypothetical protein SprV_0401465600 [Sparganum proliferum]
MSDNLVGKLIKELQKLRLQQPSAPVPEKLTRSADFSRWEARLKDYPQGVDPSSKSGTILGLLDDEVYDLALSSGISASTPASDILDGLREILGASVHPWIMQSEFRGHFQQPGEGVLDYQQALRLLGRNDAGKFILDTDASDTAIGAVLSQQQSDGTERVIQYLTQAVHPNCCGDIVIIVGANEYTSQGLARSFRRVPEEDLILYQTERYDTGDFSYEFPRPSDGDYVLTLKFSEVWFDRPGGKVFDVTINKHIKVISDLDIFARVGFITAHDEHIPLSIRNNLLQIGDSSMDITGQNSITINFLKDYANTSRLKCKLRKITSGATDPDILG